MSSELSVMNLFNTVIYMVVTGEQSPYNKMINKTKDIDIDYFEKIDRGINLLSGELSPELKDKIVEKFSQMADSYYVRGDLESKILLMIREGAESIKEEKGASACNDFFKSLAEDLESYANGVNIHPGFPKYTNADVAAMYQDAKHVTIKEFILGNNGEDILRFYSALMDNTWWACREVIVNKTNDFILRLAAKVREIM